MTRQEFIETMWVEAERIRAEDWPIKVGIGYVNGFEDAVGWIEQHLPKDFECVCGHDGGSNPPWTDGQTP